MAEPSRNGNMYAQEHSEITELGEDENRLRRSRKRVSIKLPPKVPQGEELREPESAIRRSQTVPSQAFTEVYDVSGSERRSRRNLSRVFSDAFGDEDFLVDSQKRRSASRKALLTEPSERELRTTVSKKMGRAATPLDIPFAPNPDMSRTLSAEASFHEVVEMELEASRSTLRRTRTQATTNVLDEDERTSDDQRPPLQYESSRKLRPESSSKNTISHTSSRKNGDALTRDSAKDLEQQKLSRKGDHSIKKKHPDEFATDRHVISIDPSPSKKKVSSKKVLDRRDSGKAEPDGKPISWLRLLLHFVGLIFVQYPFRYHKKWLEKMYKANRLKRPLGYKPSPDWDFTTMGMKVGAGLPSLPENATGFTPKQTRIRRQTQLDGDEDDAFDNAVQIHHGKRSSSLSGHSSFTPNRPPPGYLPRSQNITIERERRKKSRKSVEIFGDIMHVLGIHAKGGGKLKLPFGISDMDENELTGFQARFYKFIKRQHKGRLARAWDHLVHPLSSMQKKHRRSTNKTRLLRAIDKHRAQKFESGWDMVKTHTFLMGQWAFEALSPPKFTKKPMLFTVLFPLVLILFFGFMAGEYPLWKESNAESIDYKFGPQELSTWVFKSEKWRTFDDGFLVVWGARYLPLVTTESWRWLSSMLVHENFAHLGGNLLLFIVLSWPLESKYGFMRTGVICWMSGIAGNFMSAALEDSCGIVLGASGCIFGLAAFYIVDVVGDFKYVSFPCLRLMGICTFLSAFIIALSSHQEASHFSHIGGFLCGLGLSVVLVPRFIDERIEAFLPWVALFSGIVLLCFFPLIVLISVIPNLTCTSSSA